MSENTWIAIIVTLSLFAVLVSVGVQFAQPITPSTPVESQAPMTP